MQTFITDALTKMLSAVAEAVGDFSILLTYNKFKSYIAFFISLSVTLTLLPHLSRIALKLDLLDCPDEQRKIHTYPTPLVGGVGIVIGFIVSTIIVLPVEGLRGFFAGGVIIFVTGFLDDFRELGHRWKLVAQILASWLVIFYSQTVIQSFGNLLPGIQINLWKTSIPITMFCIIGVINAINLMDGLDGLAGGISLIGFFSFAVLAYVNQQIHLAYLCIALCGALLGFLRYNWHPAKVFMGDAGSLFLGFSLAYLAIALTQVKDTRIPPIVPLIILTVPITDTLIVFAKRIIDRKHPFVADRYHLHHILLRFGLSKKQAVLSLLALSFLFSIVGVGGVFFKVPEHYLFSIFLTYIAICFFGSFFIKRALRFKMNTKMRNRD